MGLVAFKRSEVSPAGDILRGRIASHLARQARKSKESDKFSVADGGLEIIFELSFLIAAACSKRDGYNPHKQHADTARSRGCVSVSSSLL